MTARTWARRLFARTPRTSRKEPARFRLYLEALEHRLAQAMLTVNSMADTANATDGYLSLREAIAIVNSPTLPTGLSQQILAQISGTLHAGGADTVGFDSTRVTSPITLGGTQLELSLAASTASVTIDGGTAGVTIDGNNASRVFLVDGGVQATLANLTVTPLSPPSIRTRATAADRRSSSWLPPSVIGPVTLAGSNTITSEPFPCRVPLICARISGLRSVGRVGLLTMAMASRSDR